LKAGELPDRVLFMSARQKKGWYINTWKQASAQLSYLDPNKEHFMVFELPDGSFIQCLGSKQELTVEIHLIHDNGLETHVIAGSGEEIGIEAIVGGPGGTVVVDRSQVLQIGDARSMIRKFLEEKSLDLRYRYKDVTSLYSE